jgi:hypothetical protein
VMFCLRASENERYRGWDQKPALGIDIEV